MTPARLSVIICLCVMLGLGTFAEVSGHGYRYGDDSGTDYPPLSEYLATVSNYKLIPSRSGQPILRARHRQYGGSCGIFSISPIIEYMGYARYAPGTSLFQTKQYLLYKAGESINGIYQASDVEKEVTLDVGYNGSAESIALDLLYWNSYFGNRNAKLMDLVQAVDAGGTTNCNDILGPLAADSYGECAASNQYSSWLRESYNGCSSCAPNEMDGMFGYFNRYSLYGCKDAKHFQFPSKIHFLDGLPAVWESPTADEAYVYRKVIKAFIDQNIPLQASIRYGGHFVTIIGYANLDSDGLPRDIITVNPRLDTQSNVPPGCSPPRPLYWVFRDMDDPRFWAVPSGPEQALLSTCEKKDNSDTEEKITILDNLRHFVIWMQHLELGCTAPDGWAYKLDQELIAYRADHDVDLPDSMLLCTPVIGVPNWGSCNLPRYATTVECRKGETDDIHRRYTIYENEYALGGHHFETEVRNTTCDKVSVILEHSEGESLKSAELKRQAWNPSTRTWETFQTWPPDHTNSVQLHDGPNGLRYQISWSESWPDNYWFCASGLDDDYTMRRTQIALKFDDDSQRIIRIGPQGPIPQPQLFVLSYKAGAASADPPMAPLNPNRLYLGLDNNGLTFNADYWIAAISSSGGVAFLGPTGWTFAWKPLLQGPLFHLDPIDITAVLPGNMPPGSYNLYFGVDTAMDGDLSLYNLFVDWTTWVVP